jgi:hypothetical protein
MAELPYIPLNTPSRHFPVGGDTVAGLASAEAARGHEPPL